MGDIDYIWCAGFEEEENFGRDVDAARSHREIRGMGKVWKREFDDEGLLAGITDVTDDTCEHEWIEQPGEPPIDVCVKCGKIRR